MTHTPNKPRARGIAEHPEITLESALIAIIARIDGVFDKPELVAFGPLSIDLRADILAIAEIAITKHRSEKGRP